MRVSIKVSKETLDALREIQERDGLSSIDETIKKCITSYNILHKYSLIDIIFKLEQKGYEIKIEKKKETKKNKKKEDEEWEEFKKRRLEFILKTTP